MLNTFGKGHLGDVEQSAGMAMPGWGRKVGREGPLRAGGTGTTLETSKSKSCCSPLPAVPGQGAAWLCREGRALGQLSTSAL